MADGTKIEWTEATWNPITGCSVKSPGCAKCYAMKLAGTRLQHHPSRAGLTVQTKTGPVWNGEVRFNEGWLDQPLRWTKPRKIFVVAHGDLFHENVPDGWIDRVFAVMILGHQHTFQVLTKRPERAVRYLSGGRDLYQRVLDAARSLRNKRPHLGDVPISDPAAGAFHRHVWIGASAERQTEADERRPWLAALASEGWNTWVSYEPALGFVDWTDWEFIRWFVGGGESGSDARPSHPEWHRASRDWCLAHGVPYFFKQWGSWAPGENCGGPMRRREKTATWFNHTWLLEDMLPSESRDLHLDDEPDVYCVGKKRAGAMLDGREWRQMPENIRGRV